MMMIWLLLCILIHQSEVIEAFHHHVMPQAGIGGDEDLPPAEWFIQILDHFDVSNSKTWKQRYRTRDTWFSVRRNAPVFLLLGGEGDADPRWMVKGSWLEYAKTFGALCFNLEHRFYGMSRPTTDISTNNLKYLSSEQALADVAYFIQGMNKKYKLSRSNKWVLFGGSYPGSLAAWARLKYPHLVHAAVSSSGAIHAKLNFKEYFETVAKLLDSSVDGCSSSVNEASRKIYEMIQNETESDIINRKLRLCQRLDPTNEYDVYSVFSQISTIVAYIVQYNRDNRFVQIATSKMSNDDICLIMTDPSVPDIVDRMAKLISMYLHLSKQTCIEFSYSKGISDLKNVSWPASSVVGERQWMYQICAELGFMVTSMKPKDLFGPTLSLDIAVKQCNDIFGPKFRREALERNVERTNRNYGGLHIDVSRVVFVYGTMDPWRLSGRYHSATDTSPAILINGTAHCADLYPARVSDPPGLTDARRKISEYIGQWLMDGLET